MTTAKEISEFYDIPLDTSGLSESATIKEWTDGAFDLSYSYRPPNSEKYKPLIYYIDISKRNSIDEAETEFNIIKTQFNNTWISAPDQSVKVIENILVSGDQNYYAIRKSNDEPFGILLVVRKENIVYSMIMSEFYTDDHSLVISLIEPDIKHLKEFKITK
ncbi:hypothetical protein [Aureibaculum marinum]|uniref:hypothetical protein n=1 Tax=Aureibaculum marinum TaxID=2487930 RepID=UPI000F4F7737|nr:hypothetical protein [Aureibaculum marinum]